MKEQKYKVIMGWLTNKNKTKDISNWIYTYDEIQNYLEEYGDTSISYGKDYVQYIDEDCEGFIDKPFIRVYGLPTSLA